MNIQTSIEQIGPREALALLAGNTINRPLSAYTVRRYAAAMKAGQWQLNGEGIQITGDGKVANGQHRLHAIAQSGATVPMLVVRGVSESAFATYDDGKKRNGNDVLAIRGEKNTAVLQTGAKVIILLTRGRTALNAATNTDVLNVVDQYPELRVWTNKYANTAKMKSVCPSHIVGVLTLASARYGFDLLDSFFRKLSTGENLSATDPAFQLREKFITLPRGTSITNETKIAFCIKAVNAHIQGKQMKILRHQEREGLPEIV